MLKKKADKQQKINVWLPLLLACTTIVGMIAGSKLKSEPALVRRPVTPVTVEPSVFGNGTMEEILHYVDAKYVDTTNSERLTERAIEKLMQELDPHSEYISAKDLETTATDLEGEFEGIGIDFVVVEDTVVVETPIADLPAARAGILSGDKIVSINDSSVTGKKVDNEYVIAKLKGKKGTKVKLGIQRSGENKIRYFSLVRTLVSNRPVEVAMMLNERVGYVRITRFSQNTFKEFMEKVNVLVEKKGLRDLVIDLRNNPGGYLEQAVDILSQIFDEKDQLLVYTNGRTVHKSEYRSSGRNRFDLQKIAILIDEGSASASEILAGAVQDWDRGVIIGRRSFGKGLVQEQYPLKNGAALRLTVARYYTPSGRCIQKPYKNRTPKEYEADEFEDRLKSGELTNADSIRFADTTKYLTANGRRIYGGGGIKPDVFVPIDPIAKNEYYLRLRQILPAYSYRMTRVNPKAWAFKTPEDLQTKFKVSEAQLSELYNFGERKGIPRNKSAIPVVREQLRKDLKAFVAKQLFGEVGYFKLSTATDPVIDQALKTLRQDDPLQLKSLRQAKK
jgi:carboxyl-terminal processing protease